MEFLKQNHVKYGLILTAALTVCLVIMELTRTNQTFEHSSPVFFIYQFLTPAVVLYLGLKAKKEMQKGKFSYKEGLKEGFKISLVFGIVSPFLFLIYYTLINPGILPYVAQSYGLTGASNGLVIGVDMLVQFLGATLFGTIYAAVVAIFVKTNKKK